MDIPLHLDRLAPSPLYRQLYDQVRNAVLTGRLSPGTRLPASRDLAVSLGVGRVTVTTAYDRLAAEGYVESRIGGYTTVAASLPAAPGSRAEHAERTRSGERLLSRRVADLRDTSVRVMERPKTRVEFDFRFMGQAFPMVEWRRMLARHWSAFENTNLLAVQSQGDSLLRAQIAQHLRSARAADCGPEQVLVTSNVEHALNLVAHLLLDPADEILIEDPCLIGSRLAFQAHGAKAVPVPVDADGIDPEAAERLTTKRTRLLYLTPSHQFPTGVTLSLPRRMRLLDWAARRGVLIVEDDQSSEYRYGDAPLESLQGLDRSDCVIYLGTFRKVIAGFVRVSYVVVPRVLVRPAVTLHASSTTGRHRSSSPRWPSSCPVACSSGTSGDCNGSIAAAATPCCRRWTSTSARPSRSVRRSPGIRCWCAGPNTRPPTNSSRRPSTRAWDSERCGRCTSADPRPILE